MLVAYVYIYQEYMYVYPYLISQSMTARTEGAGTNPSLRADVWVLVLRAAMAILLRDLDSTIHLCFEPGT